MRNLLAIAGLTVVTLGAIASTASAGEVSVFNRYSKEKIYNGYTETNVEADIHTYSVTNTDVLTIKAESYGGDFNNAYTNYYNGNIVAGSSSSNEVPVDPTAILVVTEQSSTEYTTENISIDTFSSNNFSGYSREHEAGTRF